MPGQRADILVLKQMERRQVCLELPEPGRHRRLHVRKMGEGQMSDFQANTVAIPWGNLNTVCTRILCCSAENRL